MQQERLRDGAAGKVEVLRHVGAVKLQRALVDRRGFVAPLRQEPQEARADTHLGIVRIDPAPGLALIAFEDRVEMGPQRLGLLLELLRPSLVRARPMLQMPDKLGEEAAQHARLVLDLLPDFLGQVERIVAQERREPVVLQLDGVGKRRREGVAHRLAGELVEAVAGARRGKGAGGIGLRLKLFEILMLEGGELGRLARVLWLPIRRQPNPDHGPHGRLVDDFLHGLRRAANVFGQCLREAGVRMQVRRLPHAVPLAPAVELRPEPACPALERASAAIRRGKQQLLLRVQQAAWRVLIEEIAEPAAEAKPGGPLPPLPHERRPDPQIHQPSRRVSRTRGLAVPGALILRHKAPTPPNFNFAKAYAKKAASEVVKTQRSYPHALIQLLRESPSHATLPQS